MRLYILRHGEAGHSTIGMDDNARTLTEEGREEMRRIASRLAALGVDVEVALTSPLPRALETAEIAAEALSPGGGVVVEDAFRSGCTPEEFVAAISRYDRNRVMVVGHEPDLSDLIAWLTGGSADLPKAGLARLAGSLEQDGMSLKWLLPPSVLLAEYR